MDVKRVKMALSISVVLLILVFGISFLVEKSIHVTVPAVSPVLPVSPLRAVECDIPVGFSFSYYQFHGNIVYVRHRIQQTLYAYRLPCQ